MKKEEWVSWEYYLVWLGEELNDYSYSKINVLEHLEYFRSGWNKHISPYKLLEMFSFELEENK